jgi:hypothetical protein
VLKISAPVGEGGANTPADVTIVQNLLNAHAANVGIQRLKVDGSIGSRTISAIRTFQFKVMKLQKPDGRVDPNGRTFTALMHSGTTSPSLGPVAGTDNLSGSAWWHANQAKYPNSASVSDLESSFRTKVEAFIAALQAAGATVSVSATRRNKIRAHLMHYSWDIAKGLIKPSAVPGISGLTIVWDHGTLPKSKSAAAAMVGLFDIVYRPSLTSRHISGTAIDMTISWTGTLKIKNKAGTVVSIDAPRDGSNPKLHTVGKSYGVVKLLSDPPHWSVDGH